MAKIREFIGRAHQKVGPVLGIPIMMATVYLLALLMVVVISGTLLIISALLVGFFANETQSEAIGLIIDQLIVTVFSSTFTEYSTYLAMICIGIIIVLGGLLKLAEIIAPKKEEEKVHRPRIRT